MMRVLTVLNKFKNTVSVYDVEGLVNEYEDFIESKGHMLNHCQWLVTDAPPAMKLTELERDILRFALDYTYGYLTDIKEYPEKVEEQIEALKTLTQKLLS
jgi:hypothetical protein